MDVRGTSLSRIQLLKEDPASDAPLCHLTHCQRYMNGNEHTHGENRLPEVSISSRSTTCSFKYLRLLATGV